MEAGIPFPTQLHLPMQIVLFQALFPMPATLLRSSIWKSDKKENIISTFKHLKRFASIWDDNTALMQTDFDILSLSLSLSSLQLKETSEIFPSFANGYLHATVVPELVCMLLNYSSQKHCRIGHAGADGS